jgi:hypothetical protein
MRKAKTMRKQKEDAEKDNLAEATPDSDTGMSDAGLPDKTIERGGPKGPEPTRFGDWENNGRCTDF